MASLDSSEVFCYMDTTPHAHEMKCAIDIPRRSSGRSPPPQCDNDSKMTNLRSDAWQRF